MNVGDVERVGNGVPLDLMLQDLDVDASYEIRQIYLIDVDAGEPLVPGWEWEITRTA